MLIEARARLDGQGGFRAETRKGRALKELDTGARRARGTWVGNPLVSSSGRS